MLPLFFCKTNDTGCQHTYAPTPASESRLFQHVDITLAFFHLAKKIHTFQREKTPFTRWV
jgi:hypothetical protein